MMITLLKIVVALYYIFGLFMLRGILKGLSHDMAVRYEIYLLVMLMLGILLVLSGLPPRSLAAQFIGVLYLLSLPVFLISFAYESGDICILKEAEK